MILILILFKTIYTLKPIWFVLFWILCTWNKKKSQVYFNWDDSIARGKIYGIQDFLSDFKIIYKRSLLLVINPIEALKFLLSYFLYIFWVINCVIWYSINLIFLINSPRINFFFIHPTKSFVKGLKDGFDKIDINLNTVYLVWNRLCIVKILGVSILFINGTRALNMFLWEWGTWDDLFIKTRRYFSSRNKELVINIRPGHKYTTPIQEIYNIKSITYKTHIEVISFWWEVELGEYYVKEKINLLNKLSKANIKLINQDSLGFSYLNIYLNRKVKVIYYYINDNKELLLKNIFVDRNFEGITHDSGNLNYYFDIKSQKDIKNTRLKLINKDIFIIGNILIEKKDEKREVELYFDNTDAALASEISSQLQKSYKTQVLFLVNQKQAEITRYNKKDWYKFFQCDGKYIVRIGPMDSMEWNDNIQLIHNWEKIIKSIS